MLPKNLSGQRNLAPGRYFNSYLLDSGAMLRAKHISVYSSSFGSFSLNLEPPKMSISNFVCSEVAAAAFFFRTPG